MLWPDQGGGSRVYRETKRGRPLPTDVTEFKYPLSFGGAVPAPVSVYKIRLREGAPRRLTAILPDQIPTLLYEYNHERIVFLF